MSRLAALTLCSLLGGSSAVATQGVEAAAALSRGSTFERRGDYTHAYAAYREASRLYGTVGDRDGVGRALTAVAQLHLLLGRLPDALAVTDSVYAIQVAANLKFPTDVNRESLARALRLRGEVLAQLGSFDSAAVALDSAKSYLAAVTTQSGREAEAGVVAARGALEGKRLRYQDAIRFYEQARRLYRELGDREAEADQLDMVGLYQTRQGTCEKAIAAFDEAYQLHFTTKNLDDAGFSQSQIGECRWRLGSAPDAIAAHARAIELRTDAGDRAGVAYSLVQLAGLYRESGDPKRALDTLAAAATIYQQLQNVPARADVLIKIGALYAELKDVPHALEHYRAALAIQRTRADAARRAGIFYSIGALYFDLQRADSAKTYLRSALELQREGADLPGQIRTLALLGRVAQRYDGNDAAASNYLKNALSLAARTRDQSYIAWCYVSLAQLFEQRGQYDSALAYRGYAVDLYRKTQDAVRLGNERLEIGRLHLTGGDFTAAHELIDSALVAGQSSGNRGLIGNAYRSLADLQSLQGEYQQSLALADSAIRISTEVNNSWAIAAAYTTVGNIYGALAEYGKALGYYQQVDSIYLSLGDSVARFRALNDMGKIHFWQGDYDRALALYQRALGALARGRVRNEDRAIVLGNIGEVLYEQRQYSQALRRLNEARGLADSIRATRVGAETRTLLGKVALAQGQFTLAREYLDSAYGLRVSMNEPDRLAEVDAELGRLYYQVGDLKRAQRTLQESIGTSHRIGSDKYLWGPLYTLALVSRDQGDTAVSLTLLEEAVDVLERLADRVVGGEATQKLFLSGTAQSQVYGTLIGLLNSAGKPELAFQYGERSRSASTRLRYRNMGIQLQDTSAARLVAQLRDLRATADRLAETAARRRAADTSGCTADADDPSPGQDAGRPADPAAGPGWCKASAATASLENARSVAETEYQVFVRDVMTKRQDMRLYLSAPQDFRRVKGTIPSDLAIVAYFAGPDSLYVFIATRTDVTGKVIPIAQAAPDAKVRLLVRAASTPPAAGRDTARTGVARARSAGPRPDFYALSAELYALLIAPVERELGTHHQLAIMPSGELYYLPFQMLGHRLPDSSFTYLDDERTVFYMDRMRLADSSATPPPPPLIMAFGNADGTLSSAQQEVEELRTIFPTSRVLVRDSATEALARSVPDQFNIVHFATHGNLDYRKFENSYLTLAPGGGQDGRLTLGEVWGDTTLMHRQLVVLSACNTAVTDAGGGLPESPAIGFLDGGVKTVIASLWPVNDIATSQLMADFYRNLGTMRKDEALRAAQRALRANPKYAHPYYWGAWVLIGDWR
ncbi:MAG: tetratricopeptide repeat protein [Gemmatimonadales bacterium]